jgi:release factor glutamine methyltransferase
MRTVEDAYKEFKTKLNKLYNASETDAIASLVLTDVTTLSKAHLKAFADTNLTAEQSEKLVSILKQLTTGMPVQYVLGHAFFYDLKFYVNPSVLIPRPETEELVEWILQDASKTSGLTILDIGTGSGCIPITLKDKLPDSELFAIDISTTALETATFNATVNKVNVTFVEANALHLTEPAIANQKYDIIVSNPPYVIDADRHQMHHNVTGFEPHTALFVPDHDPLLFYIAIASFATGHLKTNGLLFFEINENYGPDTVNMLVDKGFKNVELRCDMAGKHRMVRAVWPNDKLHV